jgi:hypothetical protein
MADEELEALRKRILAPWQAQRGTNVWAPWRKTGWSAVEIVAPSRKWAKGMRVNPRTGEHTAKGKVSLARLIKRDPKLKGKDRPALTPDAIFTLPEPAVKEEPQEEPQVEPEIVMEKPKLQPKSEEEEAASIRRAKRLFELFGDEPTPDDW